MGYTTDFHGEFKLDKPLTSNQGAYLNAFARTRRFQRDPKALKGVDDPTRKAVQLPLGDEGCFFVAGGGWAGQEQDESTVGYNNPPAEQPGLWCQWVPSEDGKSLVWDEGEKFYNYVEWLQYIIDNFLERWGRKISGRVEWQGEESGDRGVIHVRDNVIEAIDDEINSSEPSWTKEEL